jgi:hypothetical protein
MEQQMDAQGKKIFLLYPHSVIRDEMLDLLIMAGFETYTLLDEQKARPIAAATVKRFRKAAGID